MGFWMELEDGMGIGMGIGMIPCLSHVDMSADNPGNNSILDNRILDNSILDNTTLDGISQTCPIGGGPGA